MLLQYCSQSQCCAIVKHVRSFVPRSHLRRALRLGGVNQDKQVSSSMQSRLLLVRQVVGEWCCEVLQGVGARMWSKGERDRLPCGVVYLGE